MDRLLEREEERGAIDALVDDARRGAGRMLLVEGPAGIGKTSLLTYGRDRAGEVGLTVLDARMSPAARDRDRPGSGRRYGPPDAGAFSALGPCAGSGFASRIKSVKIGALTVPCGNLKKPVKQFPFKGVKAGEWRVFFSDTAVLDKTSDAWIRRTVVVPRSKATA
jgi:AAA ATPase-like protein